METKENTGALFSNKNKKTENHPDYTGSAMVNGKRMNISAWINTAKTDGKMYMRLKFDEFEAKDSAYSYTTTSTSVREEEVPF